MFDTAEIAELAAMLQENGRLVTHTQLGAEHYDADLGQPVTNDVTQDVYGLLSGYATDEIDGQYILAEDRKISLPGDMDPAPVVGDTVTIGTVVWTLEQINPVQPGETVVLYKCRIRKQQ